MQNKYNKFELVQNLFPEGIQSKKTMLKLNSEDNLTNLLYNDYACFLEGAIKSYIVLYLISNLNETLGKAKKANYYKEFLKKIEIPEFYTTKQRFMPNLEEIISNLKNFNLSFNSSVDTKKASNYLEFFIFSKQQINLGNNTENKDNIFTLLTNFYTSVPKQINEIEPQTKYTIERTLELFESYYAPLICSSTKDRI